jgi:hypothetical protein
LAIPAWSGPACPDELRILIGWALDARAPVSAADTIARHLASVARLDRILVALYLAVILGLTMRAWRSTMARTLVDVDETALAVATRALGSMPN